MTLLQDSLSPLEVQLLICTRCNGAIMKYVRSERTNYTCVKVVLMRETISNRCNCQELFLWVEIKVSA